MTESNTAPRTWTEADITRMLEASPLAVRRAILRIDANQTASERATHTTRETNGRGWSQFDARFGGWLAEEVRAGRPLRTEKLRGCALRLALRYRRQLLVEANRREADGRAEVGRVVQTLRLSGADVPATPAERTAYCQALLAGIRGESRDLHDGA